MGQHLNPTLRFGYKRQSAYGTPAPSSAPNYASFGAGTGEIEQQSNNIKSRIMGARSLAFIKGGGQVNMFSWNFDTIHSYDPLALININSGALDWFTIVGAYDETTDWQAQIQDCKAQSLALRLSGGDQAGALTGTLSGIGGLVTVTTTTPFTIDAPADMPFVSYDAIITLGGGAFELTSFDLTIAHQLNPKWVLAGAARTSGRKRVWDYLVEGNIDVTGTFTLQEAWSGSVVADCLTSNNGVIRLVDTCNASNIINIALTGIYMDSQAFSFPTDGELSATLPFTAKNAVITNV